MNEKEELEKYVLNNLQNDNENRKSDQTIMTELEIWAQPERGRASTQGLVEHNIEGESDDENGHEVRRSWWRWAKKQ